MRINASLRSTVLTAQSIIFSDAISSFVYPASFHSASRRCVSSNASSLRCKASTIEAASAGEGSSASTHTIIADTDEQARANEAAILGAKSFERALAELGRPFGWHDFSRHDLDAPFPDVSSEGERSFRTYAESITRLARENNLTLRQDVEHQLATQRSPFVGSPLTVANEIERWFLGGGFDGINVSVNAPSEFARFTEQVVPILRERGVVRSEYEATTLRGNLGLPIPENRHTAAQHEAPLSSPIPTPALVS